MPVSYHVVDNVARGKEARIGVCPCERGKNSPESKASHYNISGLRGHKHKKNQALS
jgi:hypothetical protein